MDMHVYICIYIYIHVCLWCWWCGFTQMHLMCAHARTCPRPLCVHDCAIRRSRGHRRMYVEDVGVGGGNAQHLFARICTGFGARASDCAMYPKRKQRRYDMNGPRNGSPGKERGRMSACKFRSAFDSFVYFFPCLCTCLLCVYMCVCYAARRPSRWRWWWLQCNWRVRASACAVHAHVLFCSVEFSAQARRVVVLVVRWWCCVCVCECVCVWCGCDCLRLVVMAIHTDLSDIAWRERE